MIALSSLTFDTQGLLIIESPGRGSSIDFADRRVTKTALTDGTVNIYDGGFSEGDATWQVVVDRATEAEVDAIRRFTTLIADVRFVSRHGSFHAVVSRYRYENGRLIFTVEAKSKLSA